MNTKLPRESRSLTFKTTIKKMKYKGLWEDTRKEMKLTMQVLYCPASAFPKIF